MTDEELDAIIEADKTPCVIFKREKPGIVGAPGCWMGGTPTLPPGLEWPVCRERYRFDLTDGEPYPLPFLMQINCAGIPVLEGEPDVPHEGFLFVFYEGLQAEINLGRVLYTAQDCTLFPNRTPPIPSEEYAKALEHWGDKMEYCQVNFTPVKSFSYNCRKSLLGKGHNYLSLLEKKQEKAAYLLHDEKIDIGGFYRDSWLNTYYVEDIWEKSDKVCLISIGVDANYMNFTLGHGGALAISFDKTDLKERRFDRPSFMLV